MRCEDAKMCLEHAAELAKAELGWVGQRSTALGLRWPMSLMDSRWHCGCKSLGLRNFGKAVRTVGGKKEGRKEKRKKRED